MRLIPDQPYQNDSAAELGIFERLSQLATVELGPDTRLFHSLSLSTHRTKRVAEADFLICGPAGLFVLEIKGGAVECREGRWIYTDRYGNQTFNHEGPFRQAEGAMFALEEKLRRLLPADVLKQFVIGYGVLLPDCSWQQDVEWDRELMLDRPRMNSLGQWLDDLINHWRQRNQLDRLATLQSVAAVEAILRPDIEASLALTPLFEEIENRVLRLTDEQLHLTAVLETNERIVCSGGAGTGKTFLALELARRWATEGHSVLLTCQSPWLRRYLQGRLRHPRLTICTTAGLNIAMQRAGTADFDRLIVDEGQDLRELDTLEQLDKALKGGLRNGRWCFFHDVNNQLGLFGGVDAGVMIRLMSLRPFALPLRLNCRNTLGILQTIQSTLGADMGTRGIGDGPIVREHCANDSVSGVEQLSQEIDYLIGKGDLPPRSITILSPFDFLDSLASQLPLELRQSIAILDEFSLQAFPPSRISFASIPAFKGLENEAIIVVDLPPPEKVADTTLHYVAMSRARTLLSVIWTEKTADEE